MEKIILIVFISVTWQLSCQINQNSEDVEKTEKTKRERGPQLSQKEYTLALSLLHRHSAVPVSERTGLQNRIYQKLSRFKMSRALVHDPFLGKKVPRIVIDGKILLPTSEIKACVMSFYKGSKGDGAKKLQHTISQHFYGIGEKKIQSCLNAFTTHRARQPRFENKAPLQYITAKSVMERHQVDLVNLSSVAVTLDGTSYRYVLSVLDVFSRFLWLRAIPTKNADTVASELYKLYIEFGPPRILQSDQGSEFKGSVKELCTRLNTKLIYSSSNHPQSQGKSERSHRTWKEKLRRDILATNAGEVCDWVSGLPVLQRVYNEGWHRSIRMTPYECMFGVKSNHALNRQSNSDTQVGEVEVIDETSDMHTEPSQEELQTHLNMIKELRSKAYKSSRISSEKMVKSNIKKKPPSKYLMGDKVFVKNIGKDKRVARGGKSIKERRVFEGTIIQSNYDKHKYKIEYINPLGKAEKRWFNVNLITSKLHDVEKNKKSRAKKEQHSCKHTPQI